MDHRPVPISRRTLLRVTVLAPLAGVPAVAAARPVAAAAPPARHAHRTLIGVI